MDGVHDLGGMHGFGPVRTGADEPVFHADWERRVLAVTLATGALGRWSIDRSRFTREQLPPATYLTSSYYEIWLRGLERLLVQARLLTPEDLCAEARAELDAAVADDDEVADDAAAAASTDGADAATTVDVASTAAADPVGSVGPNGTAARDGQPAGSGRSAPAAAVTWPALRAGLQAGTPYTRQVASDPAFAVGDRVRTSADHPSGHTRLPRYARGKLGVVVAVRGAHVLADHNAVPAGTPTPGQADWLYTVRFEGRELWGADADPTTSVSIEAWEPFLALVEPA